MRDSVASFEDAVSCLQHSGDALRHRREAPRQERHRMQQVLRDERAVSVRQRSAGDEPTRLRTEEPEVGARNGDAHRRDTLPVVPVARLWRSTRSTAFAGHRVRRGSAAGKTVLVAHSGGWARVTVSGGLRFVPIQPYSPSVKPTRKRRPNTRVRPDVYGGDGESYLSSLLEWQPMRGMSNVLGS